MRATKILVAADTHGRITDVVEFQKKEPHDMIFHLGDRVRDAVQLESLVHVPVIAVRGNNDREADIPWNRVVPVDGTRFFLTHGHRESAERMRALAEEAQCAFALFGHTHRRADRRMGMVRLLNPGSPALPRDGFRSLLSLTVTDTDVEVRFITL